MKNKILRVLTFVCFFQFSGINNGYTILTTASPLNARQSASCLTQTLSQSVTDIQKNIEPLSIVPLLKIGRGWVVSATFKAQRAIQETFQFRGSFESDRETYQADGSGISTGYRSQFEARANPLFYDKSNYLKLGKEAWSKRRLFQDNFNRALIGTSKLSRLSASHASINRDRSSAERFDLLRRRFLSRRLGSGTNGDAMEKFNVNQETL